MGTELGFLISPAPCLFLLSPSVVVASFNFSSVAAHPPLSWESTDSPDRDRQTLLAEFSL